VEIRTAEKKNCRSRTAKGQDNPVSIRDMRRETGELFLFYKTQGSISTPDEEQGIDHVCHFRLRTK
jgi:hypothetical protein